MSNSSLVNVKVSAHSGNYTKGRSGRKIEMIAIHHMAGVLTAEQCGAIFQQAGRQASSHYGIGNDGKIGLYVDEANTAWTNGNWDSNCKSVTIEVSNNKTGGQWTVGDKALNSLIKLVADIAKRNNITLVKGETVVWHRMYQATTCPGEYLLSKMDYIIEEANKLNKPTNKPATKPTTNSTKRKVGDVVEINGVYVSSISDKKLKPAVTKGTITKIIEGARNPYLLNNGNIGWVNDGCIVKVNSEATSKKSNEEIADEVIKGLWGNGTERKERLTKAGYDYDAIQDIVNKKLLG